MQTMGHYRTCAVAAAGLLAAFGAFAQPAETVIAPDGAVWDSGPGFPFDGSPKKIRKARRSASGIACIASGSGNHLCLVAFDEGVEARHVAIGNRTYVPDSERVALLKSGIEMDAEGAATDGKFFYVAGSHSRKRSDCEDNPAAQQVVKFAIDPNTGKGLRNGSGSLEGYIVTDQLRSIMLAHPDLKDFVDKCVGTKPPKEARHLKGERGVNIEGLAVKGDHLYFGFRGPAADGSTKILRVEEKAFFAGTDAKPVVMNIAVGAGRGIRDLQAVKDGILVLAGPDDDNKNVGWIVARWNGEIPASGPVTLGKVVRLDISGVARRDCDDDQKPEAIAVLDDAPDAYRILVLSDGMCDGGPLQFLIPAAAVR